MLLESDSFLHRRDMEITSLTSILKENLEKLIVSQLDKILTGLYEL
jgi:hypothetical protein